MLKEKIQDDLRLALKEKREIRLSVLRMLLAAISNREIDKRTRIWKEKPELSTEELKKESQLTDEEITKVVSSEIKKRKEALSLFEKGNREDLIKKEKAEMEVLEEYL
ncbi:MAG TPA: GatB/YqeY domain-containing protein [Candidatus Humimicrobiaceae bacterium]|nr:GatB/YqeY domain-containing protein [Candidatus Humimicrobiaceae bacterium]